MSATRRDALHCVVGGSLNSLRNLLSRIYSIELYGTIYGELLNLTVEHILWRFEKYVKELCEFVL